MKYQGMLQESSLALSGSSATSSKTDYLAAHKTITTDPHVKHLLCLSIHPSCIYYLTTEIILWLINILHSFILKLKCIGNTNKAGD